MTGSEARHALSLATQSVAVAEAAAVAVAVAVAVPLVRVEVLLAHQSRMRAASSPKQAVISQEHITSGVPMARQLL